MTNINDLYIFVLVNTKRHTGTTKKINQIKKPMIPNPMIKDRKSCAVLQYEDFKSHYAVRYSKNGSRMSEYEVMSRKQLLSFIHCIITSQQHLFPRKNPISEEKA